MWTNTRLRDHLVHIYFLIQHKYFDHHFPINNVECSFQMITSAVRFDDATSRSKMGSYDKFPPIRNFGLAENFFFQRFTTTVKICPLTSNFCTGVKRRLFFITIRQKVCFLFLYLSLRRDSYYWPNVWFPHHKMPDKSMLKFVFLIYMIYSFWVRI